MSFLANPGRVGQGGRTVVDATGTAVKLTEDYVRSVAVSISADSGNTGVVAVGNEHVVVTAGAQSNALAILNAGDEISLNVSDPTKIWIDATVDSEGVSWCILDAGGPRRDRANTPSA